MIEINENNQQNGNGKGKYDPDVVYRHLGADVWGKKVKGSEKETIAYSDEVKAEIDALNPETTEEE